MDFFFFCNQVLVTKCSAEFDKETCSKYIIVYTLRFHYALYSYIKSFRHIFQLQSIMQKKEFLYLRTLLRRSRKVGVTRPQTKERKREISLKKVSQTLTDSFDVKKKWLIRICSGVTTTRNAKSLTSHIRFLANINDLGFVPSDGVYQERIHATCYIHALFISTENT